MPFTTPAICSSLPLRWSQLITPSTKGQRLRFRLVTNPTKKIGTISKSERQSCTKEELIEKKGRHERRVPVQTE